MGRPAAGVGVFTEPKPRTWQHPELKASAEEHGQLVLRPAAGIPHVCVTHRYVIVLYIVLSICKCLLLLTLVVLFFLGMCHR